MATSEIGYSEVDLNLQLELIARGRAGKQTKTTADVNYMVSKIANVTLTPFDIKYIPNPDDPTKEVIDSKTPIIPAVLGGAKSLTAEYLPTGPNGFLSDRTTAITDSSISTNGFGDGIRLSSRTNTSKRIPPYLTGVEMQIGDDSLGVMQTANINITVPNPDSDLNYFESVYLRPGRAVNIVVDHPKTAILTQEETEGLLTDKIMPSTEKLEALYPGITPPEIRKRQKMNSFIFDGLIVSFTLNYQKDASVSISLTVRGTTSVYTDVSMIMSDLGKSGKSNLFGSYIVGQPPNPLANFTNKFGAAVDSLKKYDSFKFPTIVPSKFNSTTLDPSGIRSRLKLNKFSNSAAAKQYSKGFLDNNESLFGTSIEFKFMDIINRSILTQKSKDNNEPGSTTLLGVYIDKSDEINKDISYIWGEPYPGQQYNEYISLKSLIEFINTFILIKIKSVTGNSTKIIMSRDVNTCKYYPNLISADPDNILFPNQDNYGPRTWYGKLKNVKPKFLSTDEQGQNIVAHSTLIYISTKFIQDALKVTLQDSVNEFIKQVSNKIYEASGGAYAMSLITHPENQNALLYYDSNNTKGFSDVPKEFSIPMFANNENGTVVKEFEFNGKLPSDVSTLAYVLNQDSAEISESDIAPFLSYMYSANTIERVSDGSEHIGNIINNTEKRKIETTYKNTHIRYVSELTSAQVKYGTDQTDENIKVLQTALKNYIQYPTETIIDTNKFKAPVIPFDAKFTIEGINGFRYGDVLQFDGLPARYKNNTVFSILSINHVVSATGVWETEIRCIMRPRIES